MRKGFLKLLIVGCSLSAIATGAPGSPPPFDKSDIQSFYSICQDDTGQLLCLGYVAGVLDTMIGMGAAKLGPKNVRVCVDHVSYGAAFQAFLNWVPKHPDKWSRDKLEGVTDALSETWPCS